MKAETLKSIKENLKSLHKVILAVNVVWEGIPEKEMIAVLIQNASVDVSDCTSYSHEREVQKMRDIYKALQVLSEYHNYHFVNWVFKEYSCIFDGHYMSEEL